MGFQEEYDKENIKWQHISFIDNQNILDFLAQKSMNLVAIVNEESRFPKVIDSCSQFDNADVALRSCSVATLSQANITNISSKSK